MAIGDEIPESAKAIQEVAKTSNTALEIVKDFGGFVAKILGEPAEVAVGMVKDKLIYARWERQQRLTERANQFIAEKNIKGRLNPVPPKIALPIIENASLEENDELQDIWARLIASAVDPNFDGTMRTAFIDILKQLEVIDVHILEYIYICYTEANEFHIDQIKQYREPNEKIYNLGGNDVQVWMSSIIEKIGIDEESYKESVDNLLRVRCVASFIDNKKVDVPDRRNYRRFLQTVAPITTSRTERVTFNITHVYDRVCITQLGISFAKACMLQKIENHEAK